MKKTEMNVLLIIKWDRLIATCLGFFSCFEASVQ